MRVKIILHGSLRKASSTWQFECEADTPAEAINGFQRQFPLTPPGVGVKWVIRVVGCDTVQSLYSPCQTEELHLIPDFSGASATARIIVGAVLIAASFLVPGGWVIISSILLSTGLSLVLGGVLELLTPQPKNHANNVDNTNRYLGSPGNTTAINTRIAIGYGRHLVYGQIISLGMQADLSPVNNQAPTSGDRRIQSSLVSQYP